MQGSGLDPLMALGGGSQCEWTGLDALCLLGSDAAEGEGEPALASQSFVLFAFNFVLLGDIVLLHVGEIRSWCCFRNTVPFCCSGLLSICVDAGRTLCKSGRNGKEIQGNCSAYSEC